MRKRLIFRAALLGLMLVLPVAARAADEQTPNSGKPALILRLTSLEQLRGDLLYLAKLVGQEEKATQFDKMIESQIGDKGLQGVDLKKPLGAYGWVGAEGIDSSLVLLVPIADQKTFLGMLENFDIKPEKGDDGVYSANVEKVPAPVYFRFANGYVYVTARDKDVLDKDKLLAPAAVLPAGQVGMLSLIVNIDRIPDKLKDLALGGLDLQLANLKEKETADETEAQKKFHTAAIDEFGKAIQSLLREGGETSVRLDLDRKTGDVALTASVQGKSGSTMATSIQDLGKVKSITAGLLKKDAALSSEMNVRLPEKLRELLGPALEDLRKEALAKAKNEGERELRTALIEAIGPTLKAAELDMAYSLQGPGSEGLYSLVAGVKIKDGAKMEKAFRETIGKDPKTNVKLDVAKAGAVAIHRLAPKEVDEGARRVFGDKPLYLAFRDDVLLLTAGDKGLSVLKEALAVAPTTGKVMSLQVSVARIVSLADDKAMPEIARKVFGDDKDSDRLRLTLEGGKALKLRLSMKAKLIEYSYRVGEAQKK